MKATHKHAEDGYELLRQKSRQITESTLPSVMLNSNGQAIDLKDAVRLNGIDFISKAKAREWDNSPLRRVDWNWHKGVDHYAWRNPKRFELAIWYRDLFLCGLSLGRPTWSGSKLRLDFIEASPKKTPLTGLITDITISAVETYADAIGAVQLRIMNPVNDQVKKHYLHSSRGFSYNSKGDFCFKDLA